MPRPPRVYKTPAIVLRQRKLGEADKIVTLYSANYGKIDAVAKGVRRVKSRLGGHVEPLSHGSYLIARGRNLDIITQVHTIETFQAVRDDLERLSRGLYLAELVDRSTEERSENFALYRLLLDSLRRLTLTVNVDTLVRLFEMSVLGELGYRPELRRCVSCGRDLDLVTNSWAPGAGGTVCPDCRPQGFTLRPLSVDALKVLRLLQDGGYQEVEGARITPELAAQLERHLRDAIHFALDRNVRSAAFIDAVRGPGRRRPSGP